MNDVAPKGRRARTPTTPDPVEIAMEAEAAGRAPEGVAHQVLRRQSELFGWQIASERAGVFLKVLAGVAAVVAAGVLAAMAWSASRADGLLIEAFEAPPDLQAQGFTGPVLAAQLQDKLTRMQRETVAREAASAVRENRASDIRVQIPYAGVSLGEVDRLLRDALGHETSVRGELVRLASGPDAGALAVTVRVGGEPGARVVGKDGDVDALLQRAAEAVYESRDAGRYVQWLGQHGRIDDLRALAAAYAKDPSPRKRAMGLYQMAFAKRENDLAAHAQMLRAALAVDPGFCPARGDLASSEARAGRQEAALQLWRYRSDCDERNFSAEGLRSITALNQANIAGTLSDLQAGIAAYCTIFGVAPCSGSAIADAAERDQIRSSVDRDVRWRLGVAARYIVRAHDPRSAVRLLAQYDAGRVPPGQDIDWALARAMVALEREDWGGVLAAADAGDRFAIPGWNVSANIYRAYALARLGRRDEALAAAAKTPAECYPCQVWRAKAMAALDDRAGAEAGFARTNATAPLLPTALSEWAGFRLGLGDADGAIAKAREAHRRSPGYADPVLIWGQALLAKRDAKGAAAKFALAAKLAPTWGRLHLRWGEALAAAGKADEARAKWRAAAGMDLAPGDRARMTALLR